MSMNKKRATIGPSDKPFGTGQHGGEPLDIEQGGRHGQEEKGDVARRPDQGGAGYPTRPKPERKTRKGKKR
jgi:hypothetical protein